MRKIFAIIILCLVVCVACFPVAAAEDTGEITEPLPAETAEEAAETAAVSEAVTKESETVTKESEEDTEKGETETKNSAVGATDDTMIRGFYERCRRWAERNPVVFTNIMTSFGVFLYSMIRLIANVKIKKPIVAASNNAVDICQKTEERMRKTVEEVTEKIEKTFAAVEAQRRSMRAESEEATKSTIESLGKIREATNEQLEVIKGDRRAVLLMSCVVSRLLEESALPARTRDEIHTMMAEAEAIIHGGDKESSEGDGHEEL